MELATCYLSTEAASLSYYVLRVEYVTDQRD